VDIKTLMSLLDQAAKRVPATRFYWGVIAAAVAVAVINLVVGLSRLSFIAMIVVFAGAVIFFIFSRIDKSSTPVIRFAGHIILLVSTLAFALFVLTSFTLAFTCWPQLFAHLYGVETICQRKERSELDRMLDDKNYGRLSEIAGGGNPKSSCKADQNASAVQIFENGWLLAHFSENMFYALVKTGDAGIQWIKHYDTPRSETAPCIGIEGEQLLQFGFRNWYCDRLSARLRTMLGKPRTRELPVWVEFQEWPHGLLAHGLPGSDEELRTSGAFNSLVAVFLTDEPKVMEGDGRWVSFPFNAANTNESVYCTSLWYPARAGPDGYIVQDLPLPLERRPNCRRKIGPKTYVEGHRACLIFGYDYRDD
jgi:hypothetical protein